jgi:hypothetical protein
MGCRKRNRLLDIDKLLWLLRASSVAEFRLHLNAALEEAIAKDQLRREPKWTESLAVGSQAFVERIENTVRNRQETECSREDGLWILREDHGLIFRPQNEAMSLF